MANETKSWTWGRIARRIRVPLGFVFAAVYLWLARPTWTSIAAGAVIAALGVWIRAMASGHVKKNEQLTMTGPYAYTRNPLYLGSIVIAIGFAIAALNLWIGILLLAMFLAIYVPVIRGEETFLRQTFPEYDGYARRVPRLFPSLRTTSNPGGGFSRALYIQHREYNAILGAAAVLLTLIGKLVYLSR